MSKRPSWDAYFMKIAHVVKERSTCLRRNVGCVIVLDKRILATGYNGAAKGLPHCLDIGCLRDQLQIPSGTQHEICRAIHAEQNAIAQAASSSTNIKGATLYCTIQPCVLCAKTLINAGIARIVYEGDYPDRLAMEVLEQSSIKVERHLGDGRREVVFDPSKSRKEQPAEGKGAEVLGEEGSAAQQYRNKS